MIARTWRGWAWFATADEYQRHYGTHPAAHLREVPGFGGARLLRPVDGDAVRLTSITFFRRHGDGAGGSGSSA